HAACWALYWRQVWQMASSASISSWLRVGRPAAIHLDTALVYRAARLMMPGRGGGDCLAWVLAEPVAPSCFAVIAGRRWRCRCLANSRRAAGSLAAVITRLAYRKFARIGVGNYNARQHFVRSWGRLIMKNQVVLI